MPRHTVLLFTLATLSTTSLLHAQAASSAGQNPDSQPVISQPAPVVREAPAPAPPMRPRPAARPLQLRVGQVLSPPNGIANALAVPGVYVRVAPNSSVRALSLNADTTELRVERGIVNVSVNHPADNLLVLVDLPGGSVSLVRDGVYTFNASTKTMRVFAGEADANAEGQADRKPVKVKEGHEVVFAGPHLKAAEFQPGQARADLLPGPADPMGYPHREYAAYPEYFGGYPGYYPGYFYDGPYPYYGSPYWGDPFGFWDYPFGFGFYGVYGGGFYGGGYVGRPIIRRLR